MTSRAIANGWPLGIGRPFFEPPPTPTLLNTYANTTLVYANSPIFAPSLLALQQRLAALGY